MVKAAKAIKKRTEPGPLKRRFAVVVTRLHGEYGTRAEAVREMNKVKLRKDEWSIVISQEKKR